MHDSTKKIAAIGDKDSVLGFRAVGFDVRICDSASSAAEELKNICDSDQYAIVYMTDILMKEMTDMISVYSERALPAIISIPSKLGTSGYGIARVKKSVEKAIGADILFKD